MKAISIRVPELTRARRLVAHQLVESEQCDQCPAHLTTDTKMIERNETAAASNASDRVVRRIDMRFSLP